MIQIDIEKVTLVDVQNLQKIAKETFHETFSAENTEEDMRCYLDATFSIEKLSEGLSNENSEFYFAKFQNSILGYLKLNFGKSQTQLQDENAMQIERLYISKEFQSKKIGKLLLDKAILIAKNRNKNYVWLGVWSQNLRAIKFYEKNGFTAFDTVVFKLGTDEQKDLMMKLIL